MAKGVFICYEPKNFTPAHQQIIAQCNAVLEDFASQGFTLTVRQLFYQGVAKNWWKNTYNSYKRISDIVNDGRMAGVIAWTAIEDRGRNLMGTNTFDSVPEFLKAKQPDFALDLWANQDWRPEVWVEKQALEGVIGQICERLQVDYFSTKGYNSQSEQWRAGRRMARYVHKGQRPIVFHLGDHDPSGCDMTRDNRDRLSTFAGMPITVVRLALNRDQIKQYDPPPNYVKVDARGEYTDSRAKQYVEEHGEQSWELDALSPRVISDLIEENILRIRDPDKWEEMLEEETNDKMLLEEFIKKFGAE